MTPWRRHSPSTVGWPAPGRQNQRSGRRSPLLRPWNIVHQTISTSSTTAPMASRMMTHMRAVLAAPGRFCRRLLPAAILGALAACSSVPIDDGAEAPSAAPPAVNAPANAPVTAPVNAPIEPPFAAPATLRPNAHWVAADWADLPGWNADNLSELWPALLRSCAKPAAGWAKFCAQARSAVTPAFDDDAARAWLQQRLQPYRVESLDGATSGLMTGYFEPLISATRQQQPGYQVPIYGLPPDLASRKPYWTRQQIDSLPAAQAALRSRVVAWVGDPLDALILQIQGSGRLDIVGLDGQHQVVRVAFAGHNDQPYKSVGRWLIDHGELTPTQASWPGIKRWAHDHPDRLNEMLWSNPRTVFFREEALPDPSLGPTGAAGVALTPGRSIAVDARSIPYGTPVWVDSTWPLSTRPLRRLTMAQDTGSAITGAVRADYFWGWGGDTEDQAGRMKQALRLWVLWPRG